MSDAVDLPGGPRPRRRQPRPGLPPGFDPGALAVRDGDEEDSSYGVHVIKDRPGRRRVLFVGWSGRVSGSFVVRRGVLVKVLRPAAARRLVDRAGALADVLPDDARQLPRAPAVVASDPEGGWVALEAWRGRSLACWPDGPRRIRAVASAAAALARLENAREIVARWPGARWDAACEIDRLHTVFDDAGLRPPSWVESLAGRLRRAARQAPWVAAHRDLNEEQIVVEDGEETLARHWVDWDAVSVAPAGLDLGNLLAHERLRSPDPGEGESATDPPARGPAIRAYQAAGGMADAEAIAVWEAVACARLAALARLPAVLSVWRHPGWVPRPPAARAARLRRSRGLLKTAQRLGEAAPGS